MIDAFTPPRNRGLTPTLLRIGLYGALGLFAVYFLLPLAVMISTSLKSLDEIHTGSLISLPKSITFDAWIYAWNQACIGTDCIGLGPHFWNSIKFVVPGVVISTFLGAVNGYALTKFRFPGANLVFGMLLFGCFIPFQVVILPMAITLGELGLA